MAKISRFASALLQATDTLSQTLSKSSNTLQDEHVYWYPDTWDVRRKYAGDLFGQDRYLGLLRCFFFRALDSDGERLFRSSEDWKILQDATHLHVAIAGIAAEMVGQGGSDLLEEIEADANQVATKNSLAQPESGSAS